MTTKTKQRVTRAQAEEVLAEVKRVLAPYIYDEVEPVLVMDWDWPGEPTPTILAEGLLYDWAVVLSLGGRDDNGREYEPLRVPKGVFVEPYAGYALCIYPAGGEGA